MYQNRLKVLLGDVGQRAADIRHYFSLRGILTEITEKNPVEILYKALKMQPDAVILWHDTDCFDRLFEVLREADFSPLLVTVFNDTDDKDFYSNGESGVCIHILEDESVENVYNSVINGLALTHGESLSDECQTDDSTKFDNEWKISKVLCRLCVNPKYSGYVYLKDAVKIAMSDGGLKSVTKEIYPQIAALCDTTSSCIERNIRTAIRRSWVKTEVADRVKIFGLYAAKTEFIPTNSEYINVLAEFVNHNS
jgi:two-component system response regulator (stage 0 sporulation protein A)